MTIMTGEIVCVLRFVPQHEDRAEWRLCASHS